MAIAAQNTNQKPGYKQTEVGVIPEDWDVKKLGDLCDEISDGTHQTPKYTDNGIPFYSVENVTANNFLDTKYISEREHKNLIKRCNPEKGNILLTRIGSLGDTKLIDWNVNASIYVSLALLKLKKNINPFYLYCYSKSKRFIVDIEKRSLLNATPKKINKGDIGNIPIPIPQSKTEQTAIATTLCDIDSLIEALCKLIAKKRDIKQATMQQLLAGKTRLPGFSGKLKSGYKQTEVGEISVEWEVCSLGDVVTKVGSGITPTGGEKVYKKEGRPFLRSQNVGWGYLLLDDIAFIDEEIHKSFSATEIKLDDVLLNITGASIGRSAVVDNRLRGGNVNQHVCIIRADASKLNSYYLNLFLLSESGQKQIDSFQAGGNRQGLNFGQIKSFQIPLPSLSEQQAIATILSDMDAEIAALEQRRDKTRALKQGMMQELLTGKTRLL